MYIYREKVRYKSNSNIYSKLTLQVMKGDRIVEVNGVRNSSVQMMEVLSADSQLHP